MAAAAFAELTAPRGQNAVPAQWPDLSQVSDEELGVLLLTAYANTAGSLRFAVQHAVETRQVRYSPDSCRRLLAVLVDGLARRDAADLPLAAGALLRCTGAWPDDLAGPAETLVRFMVGKGRIEHRRALLAVAAVAGQRVRRKIGRAIAPNGRIAQDELELALTWDTAGIALMAEVTDRSYGSPPMLPEAWQRLAATDYAGFARRALEAADARLAAIQAGEIRYVADKAFTADEVRTLERAARVALARDETWLPALLDRLLRGVAVAPTKAKTLPSQALLYAVARAAQDFPTPEAATLLRTVRGITRHAGVPKQLDRMLKKIEAALADRTEVALRLPGLGFGRDGVLRTPVGGHEAVITVTDEVELEWRGPGGKPLRSVPAAVRRDHGATVTELRDLVKRVRAHLTTLGRALEAGFTVERAQPYGRWRDELLTHPIAGTVVSRLLWEIEVSPGDWRAVLPGAAGGVLQDSAGRPVPPAGDDTAVRLWHPIRSQPGEVRAWRDLLAERQVRQPFKQAFREIYLLTPAEAETRTYSNRFAAHIVHYRQLYALLKGRGWTTELLGPWDGGAEGDAKRTLAAGEWRASFFHEYAEWAEDLELAATDQVRFDHREDGVWRAAPLADVPAIVFSEAMRDVDLFVGVTSLAADTEWADHGEDRLRAYWHRAGFGELTASAEVRRDALARIIPRTKIADRCSLDGRHLVVRGELRTYKIHLGSANILMEPDDSYLCVVPSRRKPGDKVFLPFEDERLALILSKAFLLAADSEITDESILVQIKRGG
ncbi:DUF4132 domain-containing protein [Actinomadura sp. HBU206391]|uniref:DUF4132 domain-containing protein n=1 Tax=Actinomadura sp. HBU206391 TaxID=2731692 RepID=UPI00164EFD5F|nr:DUF4132 domain-containing protein [Actinomadura sp. HBU206391]MBC6460397.1 DUF4132 domain-containing protein [Actinomadura sp. HBU206391]